MADLPSSVGPATKAFLGKETYLVVTRPVRSPEIAKRLSDHLAHQVELEKRGIMFAAGPLYPRNSDVRKLAYSCCAPVRSRKPRRRQRGSSAQGGPSHVYASEVAFERRPHHGHGRFFRSDDEARLNLRRRFVTQPSAESAREG